MAHDLNKQRRQEERKGGSFHEDQPRAKPKFLSNVTKSTSSNSIDVDDKTSKKKQKPKHKKPMAHEVPPGEREKTHDQKSESKDKIGGDSDERGTGECNNIIENDIPSIANGKAKDNKIGDSNKKGDTIEDVSDSESSADEKDKLGAEIAKRMDLKQLRELSYAAKHSTLDHLVGLSGPSSSKGTGSFHERKPEGQKLSAEVRKKETFKKGQHKPVIYVGKMYRDLKNPEDRTELLPGSGIFCDASKADEAKNAASTNVAVRRLLEGVFSDEALQTCSVTGLPPRGKGRKAYRERPDKVRPGLDPVGVKKILDKALLLQSTKHWKPRRERPYLRSQMAIRLSELHSNSTDEDEQL